MPNITATDLAREARAMLRADLLTCDAITLEGLRKAAVAALEAVYRFPQVVTVRRDSPDGDGVTIQIEGPHFLGTVTMLAPDCN